MTREFGGVNKEPVLKPDQQCADIESHPLQFNCQETWQKCFCGLCQSGKTVAQHQLKRGMQRGLSLRCQDRGIRTGFGCCAACHGVRYGALLPYSGSIKARSVHRERWLCLVSQSWLIRWIIWLETSSM